MSEKELREAVTGLLLTPTTSMAASEPAKVAMAADPDVVAIAKREQHFLELAGGDPEDAINPYDPLTEKGKIWWRGYRQSTADSMRDVCKEYGFILTADGWEWTADA